MDHQAVAQLLGNYGEFVGAIAVVATLAYLATQVRHNTIAQIANSQHAVSESLRSMNLLLTQDRELLQVLNRGANDLAALEEEEVLVFTNYATSFLRAYEDAYSDYLRGILDETYWKAREGTWLRMFRSLESDNGGLPAERGCIYAGMQTFFVLSLLN